MNRISAYELLQNSPLPNRAIHTRRRVAANLFDFAGDSHAWLIRRRQPQAW
jgi:hypothetical protein